MQASLAIVIVICVATGAMMGLLVSLLSSLESTIATLKHGSRCWL